MNELKVTGNQKFMGKEIPVVSGGFGKGKKCVSDKAIAEIHGMNTFDVRRRVSDNIRRFTENVDFIDMAQRMHQAQTSEASRGGDEITTLELLQSMGYAKQAITQAEHIYILSERGYAKLIKIMDTDLAWEIHDKLIDEYFQMREGKAPKRIKNDKDSLASINTAVKTITEIYKDAGVDPTYIAVAARNIYKEKAEIDIPLPIEMEEEKLYDQTTIAIELGIVSASNKPHGQAVGAILKKLDLWDAEIIKTPFEKNGHSGIMKQYKSSVVDKARNWLESNDYPSKIHYLDSKGGEKTFTVSYAVA